MSMDVIVELQGTRELIVAFNRLNLVVAEDVKDAVNTSALNIQREAKRLCPVDTGRLRASVRPTFFAGGLAADIGTDVVYGKFVEYGTGRAGAASGVKPPASYVYGPSAGGRAKPFLTPAWDQERSTFEATIARALERRAREVGR